MEFKVPFSRASLDKLKKRTVFFRRFVRHKKDTKLQEFLNKSDVVIAREEYEAICLQGFAYAFLVTFILSSTVFVFTRVSYAIVLSFVLSFAAGFFIFFSRRVYPKVFSNRKQRDIERNLIPALQDVLVQ